MPLCIYLCRGYSPPCKKISWKVHSIERVHYFWVFIARFKVQHELECSEFLLFSVKFFLYNFFSVLSNVINETRKKLILYILDLFSFLFSILHSMEFKHKIKCETKNISPKPWTNKCLFDYQFNTLIPKVCLELFRMFSFYWINWNDKKILELAVVWSNCLILMVA